MWRKQPEVDDTNLIVKAEEILDLSDKLSDNGILNWDAPDGEWITLRTGMLPTGAVNAPARDDVVNGCSRHDGGHG